MRTAIAVEQQDGRHRTRLVGGALRAQVVGSDPSVCRIGLLATTALLLGGDHVELDVVVGPGAQLELFDVAATVAYHGRGRPAGWRLRVDVGPGARFGYAGQPLIVADGADVRRTTDLTVAAGAQVQLREVVVLGRAGERGGSLETATTLRSDGREVWLEEQQLRADADRSRPGLLGTHRVIDTVISLGQPFPAVTTQFLLAYGLGTVTRFLGSEVAASPIGPAWDELMRAGTVAGHAQGDGVRSGRRGSVPGAGTRRG